ncbi:hypothetical protein J2S70_000872 [Trueperella bonasi]|uniref:Uncharacterized protein n=1 Tax=Trueperella bonasi TaxID=312286 RepID=A0ABT9NG01_9ACTO|nr:hypothetical protein [Trueperella bonasi]MDP9806290.1 hypothetical protein [Trueperella bonasi]
MLNEIEQSTSERRMKMTGIIRIIGLILIIVVLVWLLSMIF